MVDLRVFVTERGTTRKPDGPSNSALVIWSSSCNSATKEKSQPLGAIDTT